MAESNKMEVGLEQAKSTGFTPSIKAGRGSVSALAKSTAEKKGLPVLKNAPTKEESLTSAVAPSPSGLLAIGVMMGDFKELKNSLSLSWQASNNGKIYWCAEMQGHKLDIVDGNLLVDGVLATEVILRENE